MEASVSCQQVAGTCVSVEQVLKGEMLTLCLTENILRWISRELKKRLVFIVDKTLNTG